MKKIIESCLSQNPMTRSGCRVVGTGIGRSGPSGRLMPNVERFL
jgi:hypothetical protein